MNTRFKTLFALVGVLMATQVVAQVTFYENDNFRGRSFSAEGQVRNLARNGFNDRASSVEVIGERWEVCESLRFGGRCMVLRPGQYPSPEAMGLNNRVSSARMLNDSARVDERRYAPAPVVAADYRRRHNERLFEAEVISVRAVVGPPQQRCWIEQEQVSERGNKNVPAAIAGAVIGGILGHQVGGGSGKDLATVGGAVAGAAIGANSGRDRYPSSSVTQNVQHCETVPSQARPEFWDVTYTFRGQEHRVQMTSPPGATVPVNRKGEPRS